MATKENTMTQQTTGALTIRVGDEKAPITLTGEAIAAVQRDAAEQARVQIGDVAAIHGGVSAYEDMDLSCLLGLRDSLDSAIRAVDVLIECRPLSELDVDDDGERSDG